MYYDDYKKFDKHFDIPNYKGRSISPNIYNVATHQIFNLRPPDSQVPGLSRAGH
jgi:hypothetical protein